jgi:hypothetical protein
LKTATPEPNSSVQVAERRPPSAFTQVKKFEGNKKGQFFLNRSHCKSRHSCTGVKGSPIELQANYFQLCSVPQFNIFQSCVQFEPDEERSIVRKALLASQKASLGSGYLFDGAILFASTKLRSNVKTTSIKGLIF